METRGADIVRAGTAAEGGLRRDEHLLASATNRGAEYFFGAAGRIDVGGIEQGETRLETDRDQARGFLDARRTESLERTGAAHGGGAEAQNRNLQSGAAQLAIFHAMLPRAVSD